MSKLRVLDLFSGIGGFSLGLERTGGFETVAFCEIEPFPRKVLAKHWPNVPCYEDVRTLTAERLAADGVAVDVITGGFPCQDISEAGLRRGIVEGTRSGLWSEIIRLVRALRPKFLIVENVANLLAGPSDRPGAWFGRVLGDLAECGYDAEWENIPAGAVGASHLRERIWIVAYPSENGNQEFQRTYTGAHGAGQKGPVEPNVLHSILGGARSFLGTFPTEPQMDRMVDGFPGRVDGIEALGNSVVPQIPEIIGRAIIAANVDMFSEVAA